MECREVPLGLFCLPLSLRLSPSGLIKRLLFLLRPLSVLAQPLSDRREAIGPLNERLCADRDNALRDWDGKVLLEDFNVPFGHFNGFFFEGGGQCHVTLLPGLYDKESTADPSNVESVINHRRSYGN